MSIKSFDNKVAVITGAGSGIGRALALALGEKGCNLALVDVNEQGVKETKRELRGKGLKVTTHVADVSNEKAMKALAAEVAAAQGKINLLFNNAGITYAKSFEGHSLADWKKIIGINIWGVIYGCHFFLPYLREQEGDAHIINLSSMVAFMGPPEQTSYSTTKAAIKGFSESLWAELHPQGVGVTVVHPGAIRTAIMDEALKSAEDQSAFAKTKAMVDKMAMPADKAAKKILKAVRKDKMRVVVGLDAMFFEGAKRAMPEEIHKMFLLMPQ
ncbi:SDR family NAD(P)-dependent oxidoreductase [Pseudohalioglobus lutimaris]|uniref:SDR family NAD(P)-dependent oxidoreductase n=1 Tax=Pseudohalioglobus lutimaris TaxID=1737061 RepID=UPI0018DB5019|nr:SDR family NAD(P)-dependent oxidoreductase [Pseudohalioglobus lutimaris]